MRNIWHFITTSTWNKNWLTETSALISKLVSDRSHVHSHVHTRVRGRVAFFCLSWRIDHLSTGRKEAERQETWEGEQVKGKMWRKARKECTKQHLQRRRRGDGCGCKREEAFPNNICNECNICRGRARREEGAIMDGLMMVWVTTVCRARICSLR